MTKNSEIFALKYRPQSFKDLIGHEEITTSIYNSIKINKIGKLKIYFNSSEMPEVDIYSGFVFSIRPRSKKIKRSIVGGSYNSLSSSLGLRKINACGAAINL